MTVYLLTVQDIEVGGDGQLVHSSVHSTRERAMAYLAAYCRGDWEEQGHEGPLGTDDKSAIDRYFGYWDSEMTCEVCEKDLDPNPTEVDHSPEFAALPVDEEFFGD